MTEEQEKEIDVALWSWVILTPHERRRKYKGLMKLIRTVAAESWEGGREELREALCLCDRVLPPCTICAEAERLKGQG